MTFIRGPLLHPWLGDDTPMLLFVVPVVVSAVFCGLGPALVATGLSMAVCTYFFLPPSFDWGIEHAIDRWRVAMFGVTSLLLGSLGHWLRRRYLSLTGAAQRQASELATVRDLFHQATAELERRVRQRTAELTAADAHKASSLALLDSLLAGAPIGFAFFDRQRRFLRVNRFLSAEAGGVTAETALGQTLRQVLPELSAHIEPLIDRVFATAQSALNIQLSGEVPGSVGESRTQRHWLTAFYPVSDEHGVQAVGAVFIDITEQKRTEEELARSRELFERIAEVTPAILYLYDVQEHRNTFANDSLQRILGYAPEQVAAMGANLTQRLIHPEDVARLGDDEGRYGNLGDGQVLMNEFRMRGSDGRYRWLHASEAVFSRTADARPKLVLGVAEDITARKESEQNLRRSEQRYRSLARATSSIVWILDADGHMTWAQEAWQQYTGQDWEQQRGPGWMEAIHPEDRALVRRPLEKARQQREPFQACGRLWHHASQTYRHFVAQIVPQLDEDGSLREWIASCNDVQEQWLSESALAQSRERFRVLADAAPQLVWTADPAGAMLTVNQRWLNYVGVDPEQVIGSPWIAAVHPDDLSQAQQRWTRSLGSGDAFEAQCRLRRADGAFRWHLVRALPVRDEEGLTTVWCGTCTDIGGQKRAEAHLHEARQRLETALEAADVMTWMWDIAGDRIVLEERLARLHALPAEQTARVGTRELARAIHPDDRPRVLRSLAQAVRAGQDYREEYRVLQSDGSERWLIASGRLQRDDAGRPLRMIGAALDTTERRRHEHELRALNETLERRVAERTEVAVKRAAQLRLLASELTQAEQRERRRLAQVLHDHLQQMLVAAKISLTLLRTRPQGPEMQEEVANKVDNLLDQSIQISRSLTVELSPPVLYDGGLAAGLRWLGRRMAEQHGLEVSLRADADAEPRSESIRAFLFNAAREALFNIVKHAGVKQAEMVLTQDQSQVELTVADAGKGFEPASLLDGGANSDRFGLFSIQQRLELMGGSVHIDSASDRGTRITLRAPMHATDRPERQAAAPPDLAPAEAPAEDQPPPIRVLLADDHTLFREGLIGLLRKAADVQVVGEACDGLQAVELAARLQPDVVVMDVTMPQMNGIEATRQIRAQSPAVRVIGLSMHHQEDMASAMRAAGAAAFLTKGGPAEELFAALRRQAATPAPSDA